MTKLSEKYLNLILAKMKEEDIKNFSDSEIERVFKHTVMPEKLTKLAKEARDKGIIVMTLG